VARKSPAERLEDPLRVTRAWEMMRPARTFFGLTLERFKQAIQPSLDARAEIEDLQGRLRVAILERDAADVRSFRILRGVAYTPCRVIRLREGMESCMRRWGTCRGGLAAGHAGGCAGAVSDVSGVGR